MAIQYELVLKDRDFQIIQCLGKIQDCFGVHSPKILTDIETRILEFYETHLNSKVQPKALCASLVEYYRMTGKIVAGKAMIVRVFDVDWDWFRKSIKRNLERMGLKMPSLPLMTTVY